MGLFGPKLPISAIRGSSGPDGSAARTRPYAARASSSAVRWRTFSTSAAIERSKTPFLSLNGHPNEPTVSNSTIAPTRGTSWPETRRAYWSAAEVPANERVFAGNVFVGDKYFETIGTPLLRGRDFNSQDAINSPPVAIITERLARSLWPEIKDPGEALGKRLRVGRSEPISCEVIGITKDSRNNIFNRIDREPEQRPAGVDPVPHQAPGTHAGDFGAMTGTVGEGLVDVGPQGTLDLGLAPTETCGSRSATGGRSSIGPGRGVLRPVGRDSPDRFTAPLLGDGRAAGDG